MEKWHFKNLSTNEKSDVSCHKISSKEKSINKLFEASMFAINDRPFWD
jgi:hypothetical protein